MNSEIIREFLKRYPFEPFAVILSNGERHEVRHPENTILMPSRLLVADPAADKLSILSLFHIAEVQMLKPKAQAS